MFFGWLALSFSGKKKGKRYGWLLNKTQTNTAALGLCVLDAPWEYCSVLL